MPDSTGLPFDDTADFEAAERGLIDAGDPIVRNDEGEVVWDNGSYGRFLTGDAPDTVHPSLWRQSTLVARQGLFEVTDGIYQVRGYDLSNMSVIEGDNRDHRHRPTDLSGDRRRRAGAIPKAPRSPAGRGGDLYP